LGQPLSCTADGLAGKPGGEDGAVVGPASKAQTEREPTNSCKEVNLGKFEQFMRLHLADILHVYYPSR